MARMGIIADIVRDAKDLGVGIIAGGARHVSFFQGRIQAVRGRVGRIKFLGKHQTRAGKLFNSGASPQATYGKEGMGVNPSLMAQWRALAARAVGGGGGKCATTLIACRLGPDKDPFVLAARDQVRMWCYLARQHTDELALRRAWSAARRDFHCHGWRTVKGPIGATAYTCIHGRAQLIIPSEAKPQCYAKQRSDCNLS